MANEIISTFTTTPYFLDDFDVLYIAETGRILSSSTTTAALSNRNTDQNSLSIAIDGQIVALSEAAIYLAVASATDRGGNEVAVGQAGLVRSVEGSGIFMVGYDNSVGNDGEIHGGSYGVSLTGSGSEVVNSGLIRSEGTAIRITGNYALAVNSGHLIGASGIFLDASSSMILNTGKIESQVFGNVIGIAAAVLVSNAVTLNLDNSGSITCASAAGTSVTGLADAVIDFSNSGDIIGATYGSRFVTTSTGEVNALNSGLIDGRTYGLYTSGGTLHLNNLAEGTITSTGLALFSGAVLNLHNAGTIAAAGANAVAVKLGAAAGFSSMTNTGTISADYSTAIDATSVASGGGIFLTNFGTIIGSYLGGAVGDNLVNRGVMTSVFSNDGNDSVRNRGLISDYVALGNGNDTYDGRRGEVGAWVDGGQNDDLLQGGAQEDDLRGGIGNDTAIGGNGDDVLSGSLGLDLLQGGGGNDTLTGGGDADVMTGGAGSDLFVFASAAEIGLGAVRDRITDFNNGNDTLDLSAFMAGGSFIGSAGFAGGGQPAVRYDSALGRLAGDVNGDAVADWQMTLANKPVLTAGDFVF